MTMLTESPGETRNSHDSRAFAEVRLVRGGKVASGLLAVQAVSEWGAKEDSCTGTVESSDNLREVRFTPA